MKTPFGWINKIGNVSSFKRDRRFGWDSMWVPKEKFKLDSGEGGRKREHKGDRSIHSILLMVK